MLHPAWQAVETRNSTTGALTGYMLYLLPQVPTLSLR